MIDATLAAAEVETQIPGCTHKKTAIYGGMTHPLHAFRGERAVSYLRFSSPQQSLGGSAQRQFAGTVALCETHGLVLDEDVRDLGKSGWSGAHLSGALGAFLARVERGEVPAKLLLVEALDRLSRQQPLDALHQLTGLIRAGIAVYTCVDQRLYDRATLKDNVGTLFMSIGLMVGAHSESANKSMRVRESWIGRRDDVTRLCPSWITIVQDHAGPRFAIDDDKAAVIRRIFTMCRDGIGSDAIAATLNRESVPCLSDRKRTRSGWYPSFVRKLLTGRQVRGEIELGEYKHPENGGIATRTMTGVMQTVYPAVVDESLWRAANDALAGRRGSGGQHARTMANLFTGLAVCAECSARMRVRVKGSRGNYSYFQCRDAIRAAGNGAPCPNTRYHNYPKAESSILRILGSDAVQFNDQSTESASLAEHVAVAKRKADELESAYEAQELRSREAPGMLAEKRLRQIEADHSAALASVAVLEVQQRRLAGVPRGDQLQAMRRLIGQIEAGTLPNGEHDALRTKLNADLRRTVDRIMFGADGHISIKLGPGFLKAIDIPPGAAVLIKRRVTVPVAFRHTPTEGLAADAITLSTVTDKTGRKR